MRRWKRIFGGPPPPGNVSQSGLGTGGVATGAAVGDLPVDASAALSRLELIATTAVDGLMSGKHRSRHRGGTSDFAEHRSYTPGDDLRRIDWRLHARNDRYHVRTYEDETNLRATIVVDASGSMAYRGRSASKFDVARALAASTARLLMRQRDAVGLAVIGDTVRDQVPPGLRPATLDRIGRVLATSTVAGQTDIATPLRRLGGSAARRGLMLLISDCLCDSDELGRALTTWTGAGHDVIVVRVLAPEEVHFDFRGPVTFEDLEGRRQRLEVDAGNLRALYLRQFGEHQRCIDETIRRSRAWRMDLRTDQSIDRTLRQFLIRRTAAVRAMARGGGRR